MQHLSTNSATEEVCWQTAIWRLLKWTDLSNDSESPSSQRKKTGVATPLEATGPGSKLERPHRGDVQSRWYGGNCVHLGHVRNQSSEEQNWRGGRCDQSRFKSLLLNRGEIPKPTTFVIDLLSTSTDFQRFFF